MNKDESNLELKTLMTLENFLLFISLEKNPHGVALIFLVIQKVVTKYTLGTSSCLLCLFIKMKKI